MRISGPVACLLAAVALAGCAPPEPSRAAGSSTSPTPTATPAPPIALPARVWVNAGLGVSLRKDPSSQAQRLEVLSQGAQAEVLGDRSQPDGARWYRVRAQDGTEGWLSSSYVVGTAIYRFGDAAQGWFLMLPQAYTVQTGSLVTQVKDPAGATFLQVQTAASADALPSPAPQSAVTDHSKLIEVWSYTVLEKVYRLDDGRYLTVVRVPVTGRAFQFAFWTPDNDPPLVAQVLASVSLP